MEAENFGKFKKNSQHSDKHHDLTGEKKILNYNLILNYIRNS